MRGKLSYEQAEVLKPFVDAACVHDLGAGDHVLSNELVRLGAREVVAVDAFGPHKYVLPRVRVVTTTFARFVEHVGVAFVSWPQEYGTDGLAEICATASLVIYLGSNFDGTVCGSPDFWHAMLKRQVMAYAPERKNSLIVYGAPRAVREYRAWLPEERAAIVNDHIWRYDEAIERAGEHAGAPRNNPS